MNDALDKRQVTNSGTPLDILRARATAAGLMIDRPPGMGLAITDGTSRLLTITIDYGVLDIQAAHGLLDWWERRDWVECPKCKGEGWYDEAISAAPLHNFMVYCFKCDGEGRVPPGAVGA